MAMGVGIRPTARPSAELSSAQNVGAGPYRASMRAAACWLTSARLSFSDGVSWPPASVHSSASSTNLRMDSARDTASLASSTAS